MKHRVCCQRGCQRPYHKDCGSFDSDQCALHKEEVQKDAATMMELNLTGRRKLFSILPQEQQQ